MGQPLCPVGLNDFRHGHAQAILDDDHFSAGDQAVFNKSFKAKDFEPDNRYLINYYGPKGTFKTISFKEVIRSAKNKSLTGKIAIVTKAPLSIYNNTLYGPMTTAEIHANIIENMLKNSWIKFNKLYTIIVSIIFGSFFFLSFKKKMSFPLIVLVGAYFVLTYIFFRVSGLMAYGSCILATIISLYIISKVPWDPWGLVEDRGRSVT